MLKLELDTWVTVTREEPTPTIVTLFTPLSVATEASAIAKVNPPVLLEVAERGKSASPKSLVISLKVIDGSILLTTSVIVASILL